MTPVRKKKKSRATSARATSRKKAARGSKKPAKKAKPQRAQTASRKAATAKAKSKSKAPPRRPAEKARAPKVSPPKAAPRPRRRALPAVRKLVPLPTLGTGATSRLGVKYACFECGAKFYDLNRPEPLCPKCGVDQRNRPAAATKSKGVTKKRRRKRDRAMSPLLDDDGESIVVEGPPEPAALGITVVVDSPEDVSDEEEYDQDEDADTK